MDYTPILADYKMLRQAGVPLHTGIAKMLSRDDMNAAARALGMLRPGDVTYFDTEEEVGILMEYALYDIFRDGKNAIDRYVEQHPPAEGTVEMRLLRSLRRATYEIVEIKSIVPGVGLVGQAIGGPEAPFLLIDVNLSKSVQPGLAFAGRIHCPATNWCMTTGIVLPLDRESITSIIAATKDYASRNGGAEPPEPERTAMIIRSCLAAGASHRIRTAEPGAEPADFAAPADFATPAPPLRAGPRIGRNDPCPCGSGKKYKKCCGG